MDDDTGECSCWEHFCLLHNPDYERRWQRKLAAYREAGGLPHEEGGGEAGTLVVTGDSGIDSTAIDELISEALVSAQSCSGCRAGPLPAGPSRHETAAQIT